MAAKTSESTAPPVLGKYAPFARLGHGGMADVFLAIARGPVGFNKLAVVKRLRNPDDAARLEMFLDEARLSARVRHPNIVNTYEVGEAKGQYFIAMEYLEGQPLQAVITTLAGKGRPLDETLAAFVAMQAAKGLHYAHELTDFDGTPLQVVHRDVSPHNLFLTYRGEVKLLDFGIAKAALNSTHTETGMLKGKVRYMAPEQIGERGVDRRADVFSLGIVLWEMLAGRPLYRGDVTSILTRITTDHAPSIRTARADVSAELERIVAKALQRDLEARYATADAMRADLEAILRGKQDAADTTLAGTLNEAFAETRDAVRARIKAFIAEVPPTSGSTSAPNLAQAAELLPVLFSGEASVSGSGSGSDRRSAGGRAATGGSTNNVMLQSAPPPSEPTSGVTAARKRTPWGWIALAGAAIVAVAGFAVLGKPASPAAPVSSAAPVAAAPSTTPVHVESVPAGALVEWNGQPLARTPADVQLLPGAQTLTISRDGYEPENVTIDVKLQEPTAREIVLRAKAKAEPAAVAPAVTLSGSRSSRHSPAVPPSRAPAPAASSAPPAATASAHPKIRVVGDDDAP